MKNALLLGLCSALAACSSTPDEHADIVIENAQIIDVQTGAIAAKQSLAIRDGIIIKRSDKPLSSQYQSSTLIDAKGQYAMPGLWDMHVHFGGGDELIEENKQLLPLYLAYGVTTVRDAAADLSESVLSWREQVKQGQLVGPTIFTSGPKLEGKGSIWPGDLEVETTEEMHAAMDLLDSMDVDFIKITDSALTPELYIKAVHEVKKRGYQISGHIPFSLSVTDVSKAGLDAIEHMTYMLKAAAKNEADISAKVASKELSYRTALPIITTQFDEPTAIEKFTVLANNDTAVVPTLIGGKITAYIDEDNHQDDAYLDFLGKGLKATYQWRVDRANKDTPAQIKQRKERFIKTAQLLPIAQQAGVSIIAGTDAGFLNSYIYPGLSLHQELSIFTEYGLTPLQTLQAATLAGPKFLNKQQQYGALSEGKVADLILLSENPLIDIRNTQTLKGVVSHSTFYDSNALERLKQQAKAFVASQP
ncbi:MULTISPECIES: amidohydrolase family protein [Pseudoalteromonas]|uniref:amidohydrolase family protein n=1 Tax=Pseudoalteromonas TaxID=53246 RepID=UPI0007822316|nr:MULTISPECIES: amidohydrolase family protein [Pseudoalteromonas]MCO7205966.1 amidohydrolase family protein [Pseudoalteromonas sp. CnMc7-37]